MFKPMKDKILEILEKHLPEGYAYKHIAKELSQLMNKPTVAKLSTNELRKELKAFNDWMCGNQYDGRIPLIDTCIDEYLASRPDSKVITDKDMDHAITGN